MRLLFENAQSRIDCILKAVIKCCAQHPNTTAAIVTGTAFLAGLIEGARREKASTPNEKIAKPI